MYSVDFRFKLLVYLIAEILIGVIEEVNLFGISKDAFVCRILILLSQAVGLLGLFLIFEVLVDDKN